MTKYFLSKQGIWFKTTSILLQSLFFLPVNFIISFILSKGIKELYNIDNAKILPICMIAFCIVWTLKNSFVRFDGSKLVLRSFAGTKQVVKLENISNIRIITSKELRNIILNTRGNNPLISNCASLLIPIGKVITFNTEFGRTVIIGVWNYEKLHKLLNEFSNNITYDAVETTNLVFNKSNISYVHKYTLSMTILGYIKAYFKNFAQTIVYPLFISTLILLFLCQLDLPAIVNILISATVFVILTSIAYCNVITVKIYADQKLIRLSYFNKNDKNIIKFSRLNSINYIEHYNKLKEINRHSPQDINIPIKENTSAVKLTINDTNIVLSVNDNKSLYKLLNDLNQ